MNDGFFEPVTRSFLLLLDFLPRLFALAAVLLAGLIAAWIVRRLVFWLMSLFRFEELARKLHLANAFAFLRVSRPFPALVADLVYFLILVAFLIVGLDALDPMSPGALVASFYGFLPRLMIALLILIASYVVSVFVCQWALVAAVNAQWRGARAISGGVQFLILSLGLSMALEEIGVARGIVISAFALSFGGVVLALALAFGIGGADIARRALETKIGGHKNHEPDEISHL
jgi:hypothetical protein